MLVRAGTGVNRDDASRMLEDRWRRVDRTTWDKRVQGGDGQVWYEMLLGYSLDKVPASDIFEPLRDDASFIASKLARVPSTRNGMRTEAYFYDAVRLNAKGDHARAMDSLKQVIALDHNSYIEYDLAQHLLRQGANRR
jgi:lipoprotein NlpI